MLSRPYGYRFLCTFVLLRSSRAAILRYTCAPEADSHVAVAPVTNPDKERRDSPRFKLKVPIEIYTEGSTSPLRGATSDLSLTGCYIESIFPFPVGTNLELKIQLADTLVLLGTVVTSDPQVGNGVHFTRTLPEDIEQLRAFLAAAEQSESQ